MGGKSSGGLPNITGYLSLHVRTKVNGTATGAFYIDSVGTNYSGDYREGGQGNLGFNAYNSSTAYNRTDNDVHPKYLRTIYIIKYI